MADSAKADPDVNDTDLDIPYAEAMAELETILAELERPDVDIDELAQKVKRAAQLIEHCRGRIERARFDVSEAVDHLAPQSEASPMDDG